MNPEDTHKLVAETICSNIKGCSYDDAHEMFDRIHRGPLIKTQAKLGSGTFMLPSINGAIVNI